MAFISCLCFQSVLVLLYKFTQWKKYQHTYKEFGASSSLMEMGANDVQWMKHFARFAEVGVLEWGITVRSLEVRPRAAAQDRSHHRLNDLRDRTTLLCRSIGLHRSTGVTFASAFVPSGYIHIRHVVGYDSLKINKNSIFSDENLDTWYIAIQLC